MNSTTPSMLAMHVDMMDADPEASGDLILEILTSDPVEVSRNGFAWAAGLATVALVRAGRTPTEAAEAVASIVADADRARYAEGGS